MALHDQKGCVALHVDHLDIMNAVVLLMMALASHDTNNDIT